MDDFLNENNKDLKGGDAVEPLEDVLSDHKSEPLIGYPTPQEEKKQETHQLSRQDNNQLFVPNSSTKDPLVPQDCS